MPRMVPLVRRAGNCSVSARGKTVTRRLIEGGCAYGSRPRIRCLPTSGAARSCRASSHARSSRWRGKA